MLTSLTSDGLVEVEGTPGDDTIAVLVAGGQFVVEINGASVSYDNELVKGLYVEALDGDDRIRIDSSVLQTTLIFGGEGNDVILGGSGVDVVAGGEGDDTIYGNVANDTLLGDGPNSLAEVPVPQPGELPLASAVNARAAVDFERVDPNSPEPDPLALQKYLSRVSGINSGSDVVVGGTGHDMIFAGAENDRVSGDGPNVPPISVPPVEVADDALGDAASLDANVADTAINPLPANDYIEGGTGDDIVNSGPGNDLVLGGSGNDTLTTGLGADIAVGGGGDDAISTGAGRDRILGDGPNTINQVVGGDGVANIYLANSALGAGNDTIDAGRGNDLVYTGDTTGNAVNLVFGGAGDDTIFGGRGRDAIVGGAGNDNIRSGASNDIVLGDGVNSFAELPVPGQREPATVDLRSSAPLVTDLTAADLAQPDPFALHRYLSRVGGVNAGNDKIVAGTGNDLVFAGAGNDSVQGDGANVYPQITPVPIPAPQPIPTSATGLAGGLVATAAEIADVEIIAPPNNDYIEAGQGNDRVDAGNGNNIVFGGTGDDTLHARNGNDVILGGSGNDVIRTNQGTDIVLGDGPATINQVIFNAADPYQANSRLGRGNDRISTGAGGDRVYAGRGRDAVFAGAGDDYAHGGPGGDLLVGGTGADTLIGGGGDDVIITGGPNQGPAVTPIDSLADALVRDEAALAHDQSNDFVEAGAGHDRVFAFGGNDLVFGGAGNDRLRAGGGNDILVGGDGNDKISAGAGNDIALGDGPNAFANAILSPPSGAATFDAPINPALLDLLLANSVLGRGHDVIDGGAGNDLMFGGAGRDLIFGRAGNDLLHGGHGDDQLHDDVNSGGSGADVFVGGCGADKIFANDGPGGPVDFIFFDDDDELHIDGEDELFEQPACDDEPLPGEPAPTGMATPRA